MPALGTFSKPSFLRIFEPSCVDQPQLTEEPGAHRIPNPVRGRTLSAAIKAAAREEAAAASIEWAAKEAPTRRLDVVPREQRLDYRAKTTLRMHYEQWMQASRESRIAAGTLAGASEEKIRNSLSWFERWTQPSNWPDDKPWGGLTLNRIDLETLQVAVDAAMSELSSNYVRNLWASLRIVVNDAVKRKVARKIEGLKFERSSKETVVLTEAEIETCYRSLSAFPVLQVAFVVGINTGLRPVDLFLLKWEDIRTSGAHPEIVMKSRKTSKLQGIPLHDVTLAHIQRLPRKSDYLFPGFSAPDTKEPEKSRAARTRNDITKKLYEQAGLDCSTGTVTKAGRTRKTFGRLYLPWQPCRPTCNERLERHKPGSGVFVLGHSLTMNSRSYRNPSEFVVSAVRSLPQPACFLEIMK